MPAHIRAQQEPRENEYPKKQPEMSEQRLHRSERILPSLRLLIRLRGMELGMLDLQFLRSLSSSTGDRVLLSFLTRLLDLLIRSSCRRGLWTDVLCECACVGTMLR